MGSLEGEYPRGGTEQRDPGHGNEDATRWRHAHDTCFDTEFSRITPVSYPCTELSAMCCPVPAATEAVAAAEAEADAEAVAAAEAEADADAEAAAVADCRHPKTASHQPSSDHAQKNLH